MTDDQSSSIKRRLTRDWHSIFDSEENRFSKCTTRRKSFVNEVWLESTVDFHNLTFNELDFITGSSYEGQCTKVGMEGYGTYTFPHGVVYQGQFRDGMFHGKGVLIYPQDQALNCIFKNGKLTHSEFLFHAPRINTEDDIPNVLARKTSPRSELEELVEMKSDDDMDLETYCRLPDRRFYISYLEDMKGAPTERLTNDKCVQKIPGGCYDVGDGIYDPKTKWVHTYNESKTPLYMASERIHRLKLTSEESRRKFVEDIPNVPIYQTNKWIMERCRKALDQNVGYKPELYEYWFSGRHSQRQKLDMKYKHQGGKFDIQESLCEEGLKQFAGTYFI